MPRARHPDSSPTPRDSKKGIVIGKKTAILVILLVVAGGVAFSIWYVTRDRPLLTGGDSSADFAVDGSPDEGVGLNAPSGELTGAEAVGDPWPAAGLQRLWEQKVGLGYTSPIAVEGTVYTFTLSGDQDQLTALDAATGQQRWVQSYKVGVQASAEHASNPDNKLPFPCATPSVEGGSIYTYGGGGDLTRRDLANGSERWRINVLRETRSGILQWNQGSAPLVDDKRVYVQGGKGGPTAIAVDKETGKIAWQSEAKTVGGYAAPILADVQGTRQLIIFAGDTLYGMNPDTGKTIWKEPWRTNWSVNAAVPIYRDGRLFISSEYGQGAMMLRLSPTGATREWKNRSVQTKFQPAVWGEGDYLFLNNGNRLSCVRWSDGAILWTARDRDLVSEGGSIIRQGKDLIVLSGRGKLSLIRASDRGYKVLSQMQVLDGETNFSSPLAHQGRLYVKGKDTLICLALPAR